MVEASEVRLVRCPKCENLLPELPDFSVYQCGGCGTVLRGKNKGPMNDGLLKKSNEEVSRGDSEKGNAFEIASEVSRENTRVNLHDAKDKEFNKEINYLNGKYESRTENQEVFIDSERTGSRSCEIEKLGLKSLQSDVAGNCDDTTKKFEKTMNINRDRGKYCGIKINGLNHVGSRVENNRQEGRFSMGSLRPSPAMDQSGMERNRSVIDHGNFRGFSERGKGATFSYSNDGPSNGHFYDFPAQVRDKELDGFTRVASLDSYRAELFKKLDELKVQLSRSCDVVDQPIQSIAVDQSLFPPPPNPRIFMPHDSATSHGGHVQPLTQDECVQRPPYIDRNHGPVQACRRDLYTQGFYPNTRNMTNDFSSSGDPYQPQSLRKTLHQSPREYLQPLYHEHFPEWYMDFNRDPYVSHRRGPFFHQPACSCSYCYNSQTTPPKLSYPVFNSQRLWHEPGYPDFYPNADHVRHGHQGYKNCEVSNPQLHSWDYHTWTRSSSDVDSDIGAFRQRHPRRVIVARGIGRICHPIAGGSPIMTCCNCFELLKIPKKLMLVEKKQRKIRCGACSSVITFEHEVKGFAVSFTAQVKDVAGNVDDDYSETQDEILQDSQVCSNANLKNNSNNWNQSGYKFHMTNSPNFTSIEQRSDCSNSDKRHDTSGSPGEEQSPDSLIAQRDVSNSAELPSKDDTSAAHRDSPPQMLLDHSFNNKLVERYGKGNKSKRTGQDNMSLGRTMSETHILEDIPVATEMDVSFDDFLDGSVSQDMMEGSKDVDQPKIPKVSQSFFAGLIKKSLRDFSKPSHSLGNGRANVFINRQLIPYRVLKKAEKLAGPIQPGEYWYDYQAGFWGIMGQPCLGIIPPLIEEFNYPMPKNCAGGGTDVFVNGRELHQNDLDLLAARGLPIARNKYYLIEISGRVMDEQTGEELENLGKLAPTVERVGHGFGMKIPRAATTN